MLPLGGSRWTLSGGLFVLLLLAPLVAAIEPVDPEDGRELVEEVTAPVAPVVQGVGEEAKEASAKASSGASPSGPRGSPQGGDGGDAGDGEGGEGGPLVPPTPPAVERIVQKVRDTVPGDVVGRARETVAETQEQVTNAIPLQPVGSPTEAQQAPSSASAVPEGAKSGTMLVAGSILVVGATAAAATYVAIWLAGSSGMGAGAATGELRRLLPFASPLFTRFERDTVLGHPRREQLYARILQEPGISLQDLGKATGLSRTAVVHHLRLLEHQHLVISKRVGRSRHYYENGGRYGHDQKEAYAVLRNERSKAVAHFVQRNPGAMQKAVCQALGIPPSIAHWHVRRLEQAGLVQTVRQGRAVAYYPGAHFAAVAAGPQIPAETAASPSPVPARPATALPLGAPALPA